MQTTRCLYKHYNVLDVLSLQDVVDLIATRTGIFKKDVRAVLDAFKEVVCEQVASGRAVRWHQFGLFLPVVRMRREKGPDGKTVTVPEKSQLGLVFYPGRLTARLKPRVSVDLLLERGEYSGPAHRYVQSD